MIIEENVFNGIGYIIFIVLELALVIFLSARIFKMQPTTAKICFLLYSFVSGLTFSSIFVVYEITSIMYVFLIASVVFGILSLIGYTTKIDLTKLGNFCLFGLIAVIIVSIINIFISNSTLDLIISIVGLVLFLGITAYDIQKIKRLETSGLPLNNLAIYGALELYLDFINIFLHLLDLLGRDRD